MHRYCIEPCAEKVTNYYFKIAGIQYPFHGNNNWFKRLSLGDQNSLFLSHKVQKVYFHFCFNKNDQEDFRFLFFSTLRTNYTYNIFNLKE